MTKNTLLKRRRGLSEPGLVLYNQDSSEIFMQTKEPIEPRHVEQMVDEVADGGVDVMLINPQAQRTSYPSQVWQTCWDGYEPGKREFFGPVPEDGVTCREHWISQMKRLADQGSDYMELALNRCREKGMSPGVTIRMNDMHDQPWPGSHKFSRFYREHPEFHLANPSHLGWSCDGLNYMFPKVRSYFLALIRELLERYDIDMVELDFLRFVHYFPRDGAYEEHAEIMTGFMREARRLLDSFGRKIALTCRVATTPACAYELGFDAAAWAREGLVDAVTAGGFLHTHWEIPVEEYRELIGPDIPFIVSSDTAADRRKGYPYRSLPLRSDILRGWAAGYLAAGVDGLELFNFFCPRENARTADDDNRDPEAYFHPLRALKHPTSLRGQPKTYLLSGDWDEHMDTNGPVAMPVNFESGQSRRFELWLAADSDSMSAQAKALLEGPVEIERLWLQFNGRPQGHVREIRRDWPDKPDSQSVVFDISNSLLREGRNQIVLRNEGQPFRLVSLEISVTQKTTRNGRKL